MDKTLKKAKVILSEICEKFKYHDKDIMQGIEGEKLHALDVLNWAEKLSRHPSLPLKLAALFHDIDRVVTPKVGGGFKGERNSPAYFEHKKKHAKRSADFIISILRKLIPDNDILKRTEFIIIHHDDTGDEVKTLDDPELNNIVTADTFSFFTSVAQKLYDAEGEERILDKIRFMVDKIPHVTRVKLWEYQLENKLFNRLKNRVIKEYYIANNPREKIYKFCPDCKTKLGRKEINKKNLLLCPNCGFIFWNNPKPVTSAILEKDGKILMIKRSKEPLKDYWVLPGGYINYEEKSEDALIREIKEETNLDISIISLVGVYQIDNDPGGINLDIIYKGLINSGVLKIDEESSEYDFFSMDELPKLIGYKHREAILDWHKNIKR